ncbi:carotenoid oxygenase [Cercophora newfieldiana]|uniref:Carotenoid oxygenase n=1 Tax=Cercophora newfieldiana TaxID=92897 RepID=A0AA39Y2F8_9PEZI|nr:carotenoid oxygenase [Cercophora newfieldiana]
MAPQSDTARDLFSNKTPAQPTLRSPGDEDADLKAIVENLTTGVYKEWPNEAGFDGLTEERGPLEIPVSGQIPAWAIGSLYRTGPGIYKVEDTVIGTFRTNHWFDGLAHTHRFDIVPDSDGRVRVFYSSRRQSDQMMEHIRQYGDRKYYSFAQRRDPCLGLFAKIMSTWRAARASPEDKGIENISVAVHPDMPWPVDVAQPIPGAEGELSKGQKSQASLGQGGHRAGVLNNVWITTDNAGLKRFDPDTLEPIGFAAQQSLHPDLSGPTSSAHAQRDPITGDVFNFNLQFGRQPTYRIFRVSASTGETEILAAIKGPSIRPAYIHSFYLTPSFVVLCVPSSHLGLGGLKVVWERNMLDAIEPFDQTKKCKWFVVDRLHRKGLVEEFETDAGFFFHTINAFEEIPDPKTGVGNLICDVVDYPTLDVMYGLYYDVLLQRNGADEAFFGNPGRAKNAMARLTRYHIPLSGQLADVEKTGEKEAPSIRKLFSIPAPHVGELPTINPRFATKRHRYVYSIAHLGRSTSADSIVKTDVETREALFWNIPPGHNPGEAIFVENPEGTEEDDGVLLSVVLDGKNKSSYLVCLDAKTMEELGRADMGFAVGLGFHGVHVGGRL